MRWIMRCFTARLAAAGSAPAILRVTNVGTGASVAVSNGNTNVGWLVGAGFEYAFTQNWTAKLEYDYLALNNASYNVTVPGARHVDTFTNGGRNVQTFTVGVNYLFGMN